jgi:hypothetical protein
MAAVRPSIFSPAICPTRHLLTSLESFFFSPAFSKPLPPAWQLLQDDSFDELPSLESLNISIPDSTELLLAPNTLVPVIRNRAATAAANIFCFLIVPSFQNFFGIFRYNHLLPRYLSGWLFIAAKKPWVNAKKKTDKYQGISTILTAQCNMPSSYISYRTGRNKPLTGKK